MICWGQEGCAWWLWASPSTSGEGAWLARGAMAAWAELVFAEEGRWGGLFRPNTNHRCPVGFSSVCLEPPHPTGLCSETAVTQPSGRLSRCEMTW